MVSDDELARIAQRMKDHVLAALRKFGGKANLQNLYCEIERDCRELGRELPENYQSVIRQTLQAHCPEAKQYRQGAHPLFRMMKERGRGWWALRDQ